MIANTLSNVYKDITEKFSLEELEQSAESGTPFKEYVKDKLQ